MMDEAARDNLTQAVHLHQGGALDQAAEFYRKVLAQNPNHADALHLLGVVLHQKGDHAQALQFIGRALSLQPGTAEYLVNLGLVLTAMGEFDRAIAAYRQVAALQPAQASAYINLASLLRGMDRLDEAIAYYRRALILRPGDAEAHNQLGTALWDQGQIDEAIACYERATALKPDYATAHIYLGNAWFAKGQFDRAVVAYQRAAGAQPDLPEAHYNLGNAFREMGRVADAIASYQRALQLRSEYGEAHYNLAGVLRSIERLDEALAAAEKAIALRRDDGQALTLRGNILKGQGLIEEAIACYERVVALGPDNAGADANRVYTLYFLEGYDPAALLAEHRRWAQRHAEPLRHLICPHPNVRDPDRPLRIGYVSPDFREHCQTFFTTPLLSHHDHREFEIFCYSSVARPDAWTDRLRSHADAWRDIFRLDDARAAALIREDKIDILVDLTLHMKDNRLLLFARKPAPIQVTWLGYPGTTGLDTIDYRLSDPYLDPPGMDESVYSERTVRLPHSFWCYDPEAMEAGGHEVNPLPAAERGFVTFGCLNNFCKVNATVLDLWAQVLSAVSDSRLLVMAPAGEARRRLLAHLEVRGVAPERVDFVQVQGRAKYFRTYHRIDVGLDTFPYNGHTTSLDSFWMGVPVVTLMGKTVVGRAGCSELNNLGLTELIARTGEEFVQIAKGLSGDLRRLSALRSTLRERMRHSPLTDGKGFATGIEAAYRRMWRNWCGT